MNTNFEGATIWARKTIDSEIFYNKPDKWFKIWFYIVNKVNHEENKQFKRGQGFFKYEWIQEKTAATTSEIDHCVRWLKSAKQIATQKATRGMIITVLQYNLYQNLISYKSDTKSDTISETKAKQKRNKSDTINNNDKNDKNEIHNTDRSKDLQAEPEVFGNQLVNLIMETYKKNMGFYPTDRTPRFVANNMRVTINHFCKTWAPTHPQLTPEYMVEKIFAWYMKRDQLKGETLDAVRRKMKMLIEVTEEEYRKEVVQNEKK